MRLTRLTFAESIASGAVLVMFAGMVFLPDSATATRHRLERRAVEWKRTAAPALADRSLIDTDIDLRGEWSTRRRFDHTTFTFSRRADGRYDVYFSTGGCLGGCDLSRTASFIDGLIVLDAAVAEYLPRTYDTLYAIRIDGREYLLPAANVADFERGLAAGSNKWRRHVHTRMSQSGEQGG